MKLNIKETAVFAMLGALMVATKELMAVLPNIHLLGAIIVAITVFYRQKALYPIYIYVFAEGLMQGFSPWWVFNLYVWAVLWGAVMLLPRNMQKKVQPIVYSVVCSLHGFLFGTLCAPAQALLFGLDFKGTLTWIAAGLPYDCIHGVSNFFCGLLVVPIIRALAAAEKGINKNANKKCK